VTGEITCQSGDPICPPANLTVGLNGPTGSPNIAPTSFAGTSVSVSASSFPVSGTTSATSNGLWLLISGDVLRSWGVLAVNGNAFNGDIPLFCGTQTIAFTFDNGSGRAYYVANVTLTGCTTAVFRAQLTWDTGPDSDIDLHLLRPGGIMDSSNDCFYGNCQGTPLEWGAAGPAGDPILDVDDTNGYGPENIFIVSGAEAGEYRIVIHNYDESPGTRATVRLYFDDVEAARYTSLTLDAPSRIYWDVAKVRITTKQITAVNTYGSVPPAAAGAALVSPIK
jgi:hypothetical protein